MTTNQPEPNGPAVRHPAPSDLSPFFTPSGVAIVGASKDETKLGYGIVKNMRGCGYKGGIYPVNPKANEVLGLRCYPSVMDVPDPVDLAVIIVPVAQTPTVIRECCRRGLRGAIIVSGGFRESGPDGARLEDEVAAIARSCGLRLMGPNCIGVIDTVTPLDTSFVAMPERGAIGFLSQSGAICGGLINWTRGRRIGFSRFASLGNQADVDETDLLEFLGNDNQTNVIAAYLEGVSDGQRFMAAASAVSRRKPIIVLKVGATDDGSRAASSHTGALAGSEQAYDAAFRQCGIIRAGSVEDLLDWSHALSLQPLPLGDGVAVLTNAGGPGVVAVDALQRSGLHLAQLSQATVEALRSRFPPECALHNPVDLLAAGDSSGYADALRILLADPGVFGAIVLHVPHVLVDAPRVLDGIGRAADKRKPVVVSLFGDYAATPELETLHRHGLPHLPSPERASRAMGVLRQQRRWLDRQAPAAPDFKPDRQAATAIVRAARQSGRRGMPETEARGLLQAYGITLPESILARSEQEAGAAAARIGFPVALKIASPDILHKTDAGGIALGLRTARVVQKAYRAMMARAIAYTPAADIWGVEVQRMAPPGTELIIGARRDPQFGQVLMFGLGGIYVEAIADVAFRVAPIVPADASEMIREIKAFKMLQGLRGHAPADLAAIAGCLLQVSSLLVDFPEIDELDINPLVVWGPGEGVMALDCRVVLS